MRLTKSKIFLILCLSFIVGIFAGSFFSGGLMLVYFLSISVVIIIALGYRNKIALVFGLAILFFICGLWRTNMEIAKLEKLNSPTFQKGEQGGFSDGKQISEIGVIIKEPEQKDKFKQVIIKTENNLKILANISLYSDMNYGDEVKINCLLKIPENRNVIPSETRNPAASSAGNDSSGSFAGAQDDKFDYRMYLAKDKIFYLCQSAKLEKTGKNYGNKIYIALLMLKNKLEENIKKVIPEPEAGLGIGTLLGGSSRMTNAMQEKFSRTGMTHIVAVSGYNVSIIAEYLILFFIFLGLWRKQAFWAALVGIFLFVLMIGFPSSAVRAGVMGGLLLWAMKNGRLANSYNAIVFAGAVMLMINPLLLRWDIGFQLSFLAALGIIALAPFWEKQLIKKHKAFGTTEIIFLTLSAQIFVLPIIAYNFHTLSVVSLLANVLILPFVPITMLLIFLTAVSGLIFSPLSLVFAWLAYLPLKYIIWVVNTLAELPWASREVNFSWQMAVIWYTSLVVLVFLLKKYKYKKSSQ